MSAPTSHRREADHRSRAHPYRLVAVLLLALGVFGLATLEAANDPPSHWELDLFTWANDLPDWLYAVIWPFMQYGVFVTIPIAAVIAWVLRRHRLSVLLAVSGVGIYLLAKVIKQLVDRGRPDAFLELVEERETFAPGSIGYTSGHAAVAATIATLTVVHLPRPWRGISVLLVLIVAFGRMYVGAHLPLDLVGGIAMGVAAGCVALLVSAILDRRGEGPTAT